jgi:hypothetical protein
VDFQPLPIGDTVDEHALDVLLALFRAWHTRQDGAAPKRERARGMALITQLWEASQVRGRGPRGRFPKPLVLYVSAEMRELADRALEEYREELFRSTTEGEGVNRARKAAKETAIAVIVGRLAPIPRYDSDRGAKESQAYEERREALEKKLSGWSWLGRRADGLARDLTAHQLKIKPGSVRVLKHRARQGMKGD